METPETLDKKQGQDVPWLTNLSACLEKLRGDGYKEDFRADNSGLKTYSSSKTYHPKDVKIVNFYRFEGVSDPGDMSVLYVIETNDGVKGTLADGFGTYSTDDVSKFVVKVKEIQKLIPQGNA